MCATAHTAAPPTVTFAKRGPNALCVYPCATAALRAHLLRFLCARGRPLVCTPAHATQCNQRTGHHARTQNQTKLNKVLLPSVRAYAQTRHTASTDLTKQASEYGVPRCAYTRMSLLLYRAVFHFSVFVEFKKIVQ